MTENEHGKRETEANGTRGTEANQENDSSDRQTTSTDSLRGEPGVDRPPTADEIRAAEEAAIDVGYELRVYSECGGPDPRDHGCGAQIWMNGTRAVEAALRGHSMIVKCKGCGMFNRLGPPKLPKQPMVQPANPEMQRRIVEAMAKGNGGSRLVGPNVKPWRS